MAPTGQVVKDFAIARVNITPGAHAIVQRMRQGATLLLARDPADKYDPNAIMVIFPAPGRKSKIGYLPVGLAKELAPLMDAGVKIIARKAPNPLYGVCQVAYIPIALPEGLTQEDLNAATPLPPVGDSKRPKSLGYEYRKEVPDVEQYPERNADDSSDDV